jgi:hypothetical protein
MPDARTRPDDRPPAGLKAGLLIVGAVLAVHLVFALLIGVGRQDPALAGVGGTGPDVACVDGPSGAGAAGQRGACGTPAPVAPASPSDAPAGAEPATGGRGSY